MNMPGAVKLWKGIFSVLYVANRTRNDLKYWWYRTRHTEDPVVQFPDYSLQLSLTDNNITKDLLNVGGREFFSTSYLRSILSKEDIAYDLGANIGYYACLEAAHCRAVVAAEPVPETYAHLMRNLRLNGFTNVSAHMVAIGDHDGEGTMWVNESSNWSSFLKPDYGKIIETKQIPIMTLDSLVSKTGLQPTLVRMDVEGYEYEVLRGASNLLRGSGGTRFFIEIHPQMGKERWEEMITNLEQAGFLVEKLFLEPEPWNYRDAMILNRLGARFGFPMYGEHEPTYRELKRLLEAGCCPEVFLQK
jgi:FkbM family methyltransferase